jgi:phosphonatase-like hydrolase
MLPALVIFDMAGTTVDDDGGAVNRCLRAALAGAGFDVTAAQVNAVMGLPKPEAIRQLTGADTARVEALYTDFSRRMRTFYASDPAVKEIDGASAVFARLRAAGVLVALDTGFAREIADVVIARLGWERAIDGSVTSDEVPRGRPYPDMVQALQRRFGIDDAAHVAKVGDTPSDLEEGTAAGCGWVIAVTRGSHTDAELATVPHTHRIGTVAELPPLLGLDRI